LKETLHLFAIKVAFEVKMQLENATIELAFKAISVRIFPGSIHDLEGNVFIRRACNKPQQNRLFPTLRILLDTVRRRLLFINEVGIENIKLVALNNLGWRVVDIVMCLVVFVPVITCIDTIVVAGATGAVLVLPEICLQGL
jgi:hypothetical protein